MERDVIDFKITVYPLKAGEYHVHTYLPDTKRCGWAPGQTIIVTGSNETTMGETLGLSPCNNVAILSWHSTTFWDFLFL